MPPCIPSLTWTPEVKGDLEMEPVHEKVQEHVKQREQMNRHVMVDQCLHQLAFKSFYSYQKYISHRPHKAMRDALMRKKQNAISILCSHQMPLNKVRATLPIF